MSADPREQHSALPGSPGGPRHPSEEDGSAACPRCGRLEHTRWDDDEMPPPPVVELDGTLYVELGLVRDVVDDIWSQPALAFQRTVEVAHHEFMQSRKGRERYPDGCPGRCLIHKELGTGSTPRWAA